jgi:hypothetical protein
MTLRRIGSHLTYANVVASTALFIALGGVGYAAVKLPKNSVGSSQIMKNAVSGSQVKNSSLTGSDIKDKSLTAADFTGSVSGPQGAAGAQGPTGAQGATGAQGPAGDIGPAGPLLETVPPGKTLRGTFGMYGHGDVNNGLETASESVSFPIPLASAPSVKVVQNGTASAPPECPGTAATPQAAPGWLCIYENREQNQRSGGYPQATAPGSAVSPSASRYGATLFVQGQAAGTDWFFWSEGTWAVTAP